MSGFTKYIVPAAFIVLAIFNLVNSNWLEASLYILVGAAFPLMWAIRDGKIKSNLRFWNSFAWALIIVALLLFLALLRMDARI
jgi:hypothetical protein